MIQNADQKCLFFTHYKVKDLLYFSRDPPFFVKSLKSILNSTAEVQGRRNAYDVSQQTWVKGKYVAEIKPV